MIVHPFPPPHPPPGHTTLFAPLPPPPHVPEGDHPYAVALRGFDPRDGVDKNESICQSVYFTL